MFFKRFQTNIPVLMVVSLLLNLGMWLERWNDCRADFLAWLLPLDVGSQPMAKLRAVGYRIRQFWLVYHAVHGVL